MTCLGAFSKEQKYLDFWDEAQTVKKYGAMFLRGVKYGNWKYDHPSGQLQQDVNYSFVRLEGVVTYYFENGKISERA